MRRIAITGSTGLIGRSLATAIEREPGWMAVRIDREDFRGGGDTLQRKMDGCEALVHLAGESRGDDGPALYRTNIELARLAAEAAAGIPEMKRLLFGSTTHEAKQTLYHASKRDGRALFDAIAARARMNSYGILMPNTFGPGGKPFYNSVVSTFCRITADGGRPEVHAGAGTLRLIPVEELAEELSRIARGEVDPENPVLLRSRFEIEVARLAEMLCGFAAGAAPEGELENIMWNTWTTYQKEV